MHALTRPSANRPADEEHDVTVNGASDDTPKNYPPFVAYREHDDAGVRVSSGEPRTTDLLAALDAEADEEHENEPLES